MYKGQTFVKKAFFVENTAINGRVGMKVKIKALITPVIIGDLDL